MKNTDTTVVTDFGEEWSRFEQDLLTEYDFKSQFDSYFNIFPWEKLTKEPVGADIGCGSGRWAKEVAKRVSHLHLVDPSEAALKIAKKKFADDTKVEFHHATVGKLPFADESLDFAYCLGVLHHIPDTQAGISEIAMKLKPGAPFLVYLYYAFDNRPVWFRAIWRVSDLFRKVISRMPTKLKHIICDIIAYCVYFPITRLGRLVNRISPISSNWPLYYYINCSTYVLRTDALDRFGTRLEKRFTKQQIERMLKKAGFDDLTFSSGVPHWCVIGYKH